MRKITLLAAVAGLGLAFAAPAVQAQSIELGPGGVRVNPEGPREYRGGPRGYVTEEISRREATRIARGQGLVDVDQVVRNGDRFRVEGADRRGRDLRVVIDARSGDVIRVVRSGG
jgi:hypothetical protein